MADAMALPVEGGAAKGTRVVAPAPSGRALGVPR